MESNRSGSNVLVIIGIILLLCCICISVLGIVGVISAPTLQRLFRDIGLPNPVLPPVSGPATSGPPVALTRTAPEDVSKATMKTLEETVVPVNDTRQLACHLKGKCDIPETAATSPVPHAVGDTQKFWVGNQDTNENFQVDATLHYITPHVYFWVENGVKFDQQELEALADTFENKIYPTDREFFGSEWTPGIDADPHIYILYARNLGSSVGGYFSSADEMHPDAHPYSNAHEMFLFNADAPSEQLGNPYAYSTLAHEFQHMIHWVQDQNETSWINEGFSEVATLLNGYDAGGFDWLYVSSPDLQLNDWPSDHEATPPHYGASFLFLTYFLDRFGEKATQAVVHDPANGFDGIDNTLKKINTVDPVTNAPIIADDVFQDWTVTNFLLDPNVGDGRYTYHNYPAAPRAAATETVTGCPQSPQGRTVSQYGVDYIQIDCSGDHTLVFTGSTATRLLPAEPSSGTYAFWSNKGDTSDMTLTHDFDFTGVNGPITLSYKTWYDIEEEWDYLYVEASTDGETWQILKTPSGTDRNPQGNAYGWGYTGKTDGWINEDVDLSDYAGKKIQVRFEYVTDAAVNGEGLLLDDVHIDAVKYSTDFEKDEGGWEAAGFVRVENVLPQTFRLTLITRDGKTTVQNIALNPDQTAEIPLSLGSGGSAILVVSGTTRFTREPATYQFEIR